MKYVIGINNLTTKKSTIYFTYIIFKFGIKKIQFHTIKKLQVVSIRIPAYAVNNFLRK